MKWLITNCTTCPSHGLAPCEDGADVATWTAVLAAHCPDCGGGPRRVSGPVATDELPAEALEALPANWAELF
jgi:hypothetical protein